MPSCVMKRGLVVQIRSPTMVDQARPEQRTVSPPGRVMSSGGADMRASNGGPGKMWALEYSIQDPL